MRAGTFFPCCSGAASPFCSPSLPPRPPRPPPSSPRLLVFFPLQEHQRRRRIFPSRISHRLYVFFFSPFNLLLSPLSFPLDGFFLSPLSHPYYRFVATSSFFPRHAPCSCSSTLPSPFLLHFEEHSEQQPFSIPSSSLLKKTPLPPSLSPLIHSKREWRNQTFGASMIYKHSNSNTRVYTYKRAM